MSAPDRPPAENAADLPTPAGLAASGAKWTTLPYHRHWLVGEANRLFDFFIPASVNPSGGFFDLDDRGRPILTSASSGLAPPRQIHSTTRMVHSFAIAR